MSNRRAPTSPALPPTLTPLDGTSSVTDTAIGQVFPPISSDSTSHISAVEQSVKKLNDQVLAFFRLLHENQTVLSATISDIPAPSPPRLKPGLPTEFNGDRTKGKAFLFACRIYLRLRSDDFSDNSEKIIWAMSHMKSGRASRWAQRAMDEEARNGRLRFIDWLDFEEEFRADFTPPNATETAVNILEGVTYFQGNRSIDEYLDEFRDLIADSRYDARTAVVKFRRGLSWAISHILIGIVRDRPDDCDLEGWYRLTSKLDQNLASDKAFYTTTSSAISDEEPTTPPLSPPLVPSPPSPPITAARK